MVLTVFRSRLNPGVDAEYGVWTARMRELAMAMPGYVSHKAFAAPDGERVTIVEFDSEEHQRAWAKLPAHISAQRAGRDSFYSEYVLMVCTVERERRFKA